MMFHVTFLPDLIYKNVTRSTVLTLKVTTSRAASGWPRQFFGLQYLDTKTLQQIHHNTGIQGYACSFCGDNLEKPGTRFSKTAWISAQAAQSHPGFIINTCQLKSTGNMKVICLQLSELQIHLWFPVVLYP